MNKYIPNYNQFLNKNKLNEETAIATSDIKQNFIDKFINTINNFSYFTRMMYLRSNGILHEKQNAGIIMYPNKSAFSIYDKFKSLIKSFLHNGLKIFSSGKKYNYQKHINNQIKKDIEYFKKYQAPLLSNVSESYINNLYEDRVAPEIDSRMTGVPNIIGAKALVKKILLIGGAKRNIFVWGMPGIGKTEILKSMTYNNIPVYVVTKELQRYMPDEVKGIQYPDLENGRTRLLITDILPNESELVEIEKCPMSILLLDEFNRATPETMSAAMNIVQTKAIGNIKLPKNMIIVCAGNRPQDDPTSTTNVMEWAIKARFTHLNFVPLYKDWREWGIQVTKEDDTDAELLSGTKIPQNIHPVIIGFLDYMETIGRIATTGALTSLPMDVFLHMPTDPDVMVGANPREWKNASNILYNKLEQTGKTILELSELDIIDTFEGTLHPDIISEFNKYLYVIKIYDIEEFNKILNDPLNAKKLPTEDEFNSAITKANKAANESIKELKEKISEINKKSNKSQTDKDEIDKLSDEIEQYKNSKIKVLGYDSFLIALISHILLQLAIVKNNELYKFENIFVYLLNNKFRPEMLKSLMVKLEMVILPKIISTDQYKFYNLIYLIRAYDSDVYLNNMKDYIIYKFDLTKIDKSMLSAAEEFNKTEHFDIKLLFDFYKSIKQSNIEIDNNNSIEKNPLIQAIIKTDNIDKLIEAIDLTKTINENIKNILKAAGVSESNNEESITDKEVLDIIEIDVSNAYKNNFKNYVNINLYKTIYNTLADFELLKADYLYKI